MPPGPLHGAGPYGATDAAEFFAVATEAFFEKSGVLRKRHPELYEQLQSFYRQVRPGFGRSENCPCLEARTPPSSGDGRRADRECTLAMATGLLDVVPPAVLQPFSRRLVHGRSSAGRPTTSEPGATSIPSSSKAPAPTTEPRPTRAVQDDRPHPDQALILDGAAVQDDTMAHRDPVPDRAGDARVGMDHREVLDIGLLTDRDPVGIAAEDRVVPDARPRRDGRRRGRSPRGQ